MQKCSAPAAPPRPPKLRQQLLSISQIALWLPGVLPTAISLPVAEVLLNSPDCPHSQNRLHLVLLCITILQRYSLLATGIAYHCLELRHVENWMNLPAHRQLKSVGSLSHSPTDGEGASPARRQLPGATPNGQVRRGQPHTVSHSMSSSTALRVRDALHAAPRLSERRSDLVVNLGTSSNKRSNSRKLHQRGSMIKR